jgi:hypothetical protein
VIAIRDQVDGMRARQEARPVMEGERALVRCVLVCDVRFFSFVAYFELSLTLFACSVCPLHTYLIHPWGSGVRVTILADMELLDWESLV